MHAGTFENMSNNCSLLTVNIMSMPVVLNVGPGKNFGGHGDLRSYEPILVEK